MATFSFPLASSCRSRCSNAYLTNGCTPASESKIPIELLPTPPRPQVPPRQPNICAASRRRVADTGAYEGRQHSQVLTSDRVGFSLSCERIHESPAYSMYARVTIQQRARKLLQPDSAKHPGPGLIPQPALVGHRLSGLNHRHPNCTLWTSAPYSHHNRLSVWGPLLNHGPRIVGSAALGRMAPRRKRLRDSVRDGARPTKAQRQAAADVRRSGRSPVAISSGSEEETPPASSSSGARPLTAYGMSTGPTPPVVAAAIAEALDHDKLKGDLPPDQFMALARRLQRPYAALQVTPSASDYSREETVETVSDEGPHYSTHRRRPGLTGRRLSSGDCHGLCRPGGIFLAEDLSEYVETHLRSLTPPLAARNANSFDLLPKSVVVSSDHRRAQRLWWRWRLGSALRSRRLVLVQSSKHTAFFLNVWVSPWGQHPSPTAKSAGTLKFDGESMRHWPCWVVLSTPIAPRACS